VGTAANSAPTESGSGGRAVAAGAGDCVGVVIGITLE
jgi:hypothetical protein